MRQCQCHSLIDTEIHKFVDLINPRVFFFNTDKSLEMRKLLLTSSQVSVLLSTIIVISCTLALFLSGYTAQQRSLKELRTAIRPRHRPSKPYLPDQFKPKVVELEDGSQVVLESDAEREKKRHRETVVEVRQSAAARQQPVVSASQGVSLNKLKIIEQLQADVAAKSWTVENPDPLSKNAVPMTRAERRKAIKEELKRLGRSDEPVLWQRRMW
ncbi:hypothetical protein NLU13_3931 [Sarocladium strictum]|uniref:Uncharacterized protein n=1 Tax=Sarocladium strictum TaxID=5046 RepID=A0AA39GIK5_SARSR|nr:hypothetical protein NLU13_3931 [Sarocladium strictum]